MKFFSTIRTIDISVIHYIYSFPLTVPNMQFARAHKAWDPLVINYYLACTNEIKKQGSSYCTDNYDDMHVLLSM